MLCLRIFVLFTLCTILNVIVYCLQLNTGRGADANRKVDYLGTDACWMAVCVLCRNAQVNLIVIIMTCICIVMHSLFCQLPSCNLFTHHVSILLWRDTTSELWTLIHSFTSNNTTYCNHCFLSFSANKHHFPHYTSNPLFSASR